MGRMWDLVEYRRRVPHVTEVPEELEKQRESTQAYSNELTTLSGELEQTPIVQGLRKSLSKQRCYMRLVGALRVKHRELACLAEGTLAGREKAEFKASCSMHSLRA